MSGFAWRNSSNDWLGEWTLFTSSEWEKSSSNDKSNEVSKLIELGEIDACSGDCWFEGRTWRKHKRSNSCLMRKIGLSWIESDRSNVVIRWSSVLPHRTGEDCLAGSTEDIVPDLWKRKKRKPSLRIDRSFLLDKLSIRLGKYDRQREFRSALYLVWQEDRIERELNNWWSTKKCKGYDEICPFLYLHSICCNQFRNYTSDTLLHHYWLPRSKLAHSISETDEKVKWARATYRFEKSCRSNG